MKFQRRPFFSEQLLFQQYNKHRFALKLLQLDTCGTPYLATPGWKPCKAFTLNDRKTCNPDKVAFALGKAPITQVEIADQLENSIEGFLFISAIFAVQVYIHLALCITVQHRMAMSVRPVTRDPPPIF